MCITSNFLPAILIIQFREYSANEYTIQASGRENVQYVLINVTLKKRQDVFSLFNTCICPIWYRMKDFIWIEIPIERPDKTFHSEILII